MEDILRLAPMPYSIATYGEDGIEDISLLESISRAIMEPANHLYPSMSTILVYSMGVELHLVNNYVHGVDIFGNPVKYRLGKFLRKINRLANRFDSDEYRLLNDEEISDIVRTHGERTADLTSKLVIHEDAVSMYNRYKELDNIKTCVVEDEDFSPKYFNVYEATGCKLISFKGDMGLQARTILFPTIHGYVYRVLYVSNDIVTREFKDAFKAELNRLGYTSIRDIPKKDRRMSMKIPDENMVTNGYMDAMELVHKDIINNTLVFSSIELKEEGIEYLRIGLDDTYNEIDI